MITPPLRKSDKFGQGHYLASRGDYLHQGIDWIVEPGQPYYSDVNGQVTRHGYPYSSDLRYRLLEIKVDYQTIVKYMYIDPVVEPRSVIKIGQKLGTVQDLDLKFRGITPHVHFEVWVEGCHVNPEVWLEQYRSING